MGWGRFPAIEGLVERPSTIEQLRARVLSGRSLIARGNGRAYGDAALNELGTVSMLRFNRLLDFDVGTGQLVCEAGVLLDELLDVFVPRGWFPPVVPGTRFVTVGGMIAANVHGKNHPAAGAFGNHVAWLDLITADAELVRCSSTTRSELFAMTLGGMGLTGIVVRACLQLRRIPSAYLLRRRIVAADLATTLAAFQSNSTSSYAVAWIDCLARGRSSGRALVDVAEHAELADLPANLQEQPYYVPARRSLSLPFTPPFSPLNSLTVRGFNACHFRLGRLSAAVALPDFNSWFFPLDRIAHWNRLYGPRGFTQYQCVLPLAAAESGLAALLQEIAHAGCGSFLSVLKRLGSWSGGLSFPADGYTLALDFAWSETVAALLARLDAIVLAHGGHLYLAKDARLDREHFDRMQPQAARFREGRAAMGAAPVFQSLLSRRLGL